MFAKLGKAMKDAEYSKDNFEVNRVSKSFQY